MLLYSDKKRCPLTERTCVNETYDLYGQPGKEILTVRKTYGKDRIRYLRCWCYGEEFSEPKNTALWNIKSTESHAIAIEGQLAEEMSLKGAARLTRIHRETVRRLLRKLGTMLNNVTTSNWRSMC